MQKHAFGKKALTLLLTLCMVFTTIAPAASSVVYADSVSDHTGSSSVSSVDPGNASSVATGGEEQNSGSSSTPTQSQPDSTSNSTSVPAADGGGSDSTSAPPANSSSVPTDNGEETSSSSTSEIPEDSSAPENEDGTGEDESEEDKESEGDNSAEEFIPLAIIDPETGDVIEAEVGDEVTLSSLLNRDDILVSYQWQRMQQPTKRVAANIKPIYDYRLNMYTERDVAVAGMLHDIGKALLSHDLLAKDGPLDNAEIRLMQSHPVMGAKIIESHPLEHDVHRELLMDTIKCHHERWDGMGYPEGLKEEGIPLIARLCAIADTYDAVVSDRPYRKGVEAAIALNELRKAAGTQLDPYLVRCLLEC